MLLARTVFFASPRSLGRGSSVSCFSRREGRRSELRTRRLASSVNRGMNIDSALASEWPLAHSLTRHTKKPLAVNAQIMQRRYDTVPQRNALP